MCQCNLSLHCDFGLFWCLIQEEDIHLKSKWFGLVSDQQRKVVCDPDFQKCQYVGLDEVSWVEGWQKVFS